jgi:agmatinase
MKCENVTTTRTFSSTSTSHFPNNEKWFSHPTEPHIGLFGMADDTNSSFMMGSSKAPRLIRDSFFSDSSNTFCEHGLDISTYIKDFKDIYPPDIHTTSNNLIENIIVNHNLSPLILGGDHSISFPLVQSISKYLNTPLTIVHFDAHPDLYPDFQNNPHSHASPFARILERNGLCHQLISIGIRTTNKEQQKQIDKYNVKVIEARHFPAHGKDCGSLLASYITNSTPVYISFDTDVIEPALAPGVSHREAGGLSVRQVVDAIQSIPGRIIGADLVEYNPDRDIDGLTAVVASKILKELASTIIRSRLRQAQ